MDLARLAFGAGGLNMPTVYSEVEEHAIQENESAGGPSNPLPQHAHGTPAKNQSRAGLLFAASAIGLILILAAISGLWLVRSVRRLNRQVARLNRQTEQLNRRVDAAEHQATVSAQQASQAAADAQALAAQHEQSKDSKAMSAAQVAPDVQKPPAARAQSAPETIAAAAQGAAPAEKSQNPTLHENELQKVQQSLGPIAETHRTSLGLVMTLGEKSLRFDSGKSEIAPKYRATLNHIAGVLKPLKGYSISVYAYTDDAGTKDYNLTLSARRARSVRDVLVKAGIAPTLISTKGFGTSKPRGRGTSATSRATNRRVEIAIVKSTPASAAPAKLSNVAARSSHATNR
jgi:outer membrane protein OmpA-like peptidoglycan-associated protein